MSALADETIENIKIVKLFGAEGRERQRYRTLADRAHDLASKVIGLQGVRCTALRCAVLCLAGLLRCLGTEAGYRMQQGCLQQFLVRS